MREYRYLLFATVRRDLVLRYEQTLMGFVWAVFTPVVHMGIFTLVFTRVAPLATDLPYPVYAYVGLLPWNLTASALRFATVSLTNNTALLTKTNFPREVLPLSAVLVAVADFLVAATVLAGLMLYFHVGLRWTVLAVPVVLLVQLALTVGLSLFLAMANLFYRDVRHVVDLLLVAGMLMSSVVYPVDRIGGLVGWLFAVNPMTPIIEAYRSVIVRGQLPPAAPFAWACVAAGVALGAGWLLFHRVERRFAEYA